MKQKLPYLLALSFLIEILLIYTLQLVGALIALIIALLSIRLIMQHVEVPAPNIWLYYNTILVPLNITQEELESYDKERQKKLIEKEIKRILRVKGNITQVKTNIKEHGIEENITYKTKKQTLTIKLLYTQDITKLLQELG
jgi:hypothetical protein